jgi:hypothetical protein
MLSTYATATPRSDSATTPPRPPGGAPADRSAAMAMRRSPTTVAASRRQADVYVVDSERMDPLDWVCEQGVVLQSARGPLPNLAEQIAGEPISGSWWGHSSGHEIFAVLTRLLDSSDVIATRLVNGKITLIHRRLWPAVVRVADRFPAERLAAVDEVHTPSGAHRTIEIPFPEWIPAEDLDAAALLSVDEALALLPACLR